MPLETSINLTTDELSFLAVITDSYKAKREVQVTKSTRKKPSDQMELAMLTALSRKLNTMGVNATKITIINEPEPVTV